MMARQRNLSRSVLRKSIRQPNALPVLAFSVPYPAGAFAPYAQQGARANAADRPKFPEDQFDFQHQQPRGSSLTLGKKHPMSANPDEIKRRELVARDAIKRAFESDEEEMSARLFVSHHLAELESSYWKRHLSTESPAPSAVLDLLQLRSHWGGDDEMETFDFTLPEDVTNYVICVRFDGEGSVSDVDMES